MFKDVNNEHILHIQAINNISWTFIFFQKLKNLTILFLHLIWKYSNYLQPGNKL